MPVAGSATVTVGEASPACCPKRGLRKRLIHQPNHGADDFGRRVIRAGQFAERVVIDFEEVLVEIEPGFGVALADRRPVDGVQHAGEGAEGSLERGLVLGVVGEEPEGGADQRTGVSEFVGHVFKAAGELDAFGAGHQQAERHGLSVAVGEPLVGGLGEEQLAPVHGERRESRAAQGQLLGDFIAQQAAEAGADAGQVLGAARRNGHPAEELLEQTQQARRGLQRVARGLDVADERDHGVHQFPVLPEAEGVAVRVQQVRKRVEFLPLRLVMRVFELAGVGAFAGRFQFDEPHQRLVDGDRVVGARLQVADGRFAHGSDGGLGQAAKLGQVREQLLERRTKLVLRFATGARIRELGFGFGSEGGDGGLKE